MYRQKVLQMLIQKTDDIQYLQYKPSQLNQTANQTNSFTFKRAKLLQLGKCKIKLPKPYPQTPSQLTSTSIPNKNRSFTLSIQQKNNKERDGNKTTRQQSSPRKQIFQLSLMAKMHKMPMKQALILEQMFRASNNHYSKKDQKNCQKSTNQAKNIQQCSVIQKNDKQIYDTQCQQQNYKQLTMSEQFCRKQVRSKILLNNSLKTSHQNRSFNPNAQGFAEKKNSSHLLIKNHQFLIQEQKKIKIINRKQIYKNYAKPFIQPPKISSVSYVIYQSVSEFTTSPKLHYSHQSKNVLQIASLTKIMTCILTIDLCAKFCLNMSKELVQIGNFESSIPGTSAKLQKGDQYTLEQLLYGLMLPSGNDASVAIAVFIGKKLLNYDRQKKLRPGQKANEVSKSQQYNVLKKSCYLRFISQMNIKANQLGMVKTYFANSHGLAHQLAKSCSFDIALLCDYAMKNSIFAKVVGCKTYKCNILTTAYVEEQKRQISTQKNNFVSQTCSISSQEQLSIEYIQEKDNDSSQKYSQEEICKAKQVQKPQRYSQKSIVWQNTHKLLHQKPKEYIGIKTGVTNSAGPCLASCIETPQRRKFIIVILNCKNMKWRFKQTQMLKKWVYKKQGISGVKRRNEQEFLKILQNGQNKKQQQIVQRVRSQPYYSLQNIST